MAALPSSATMFVRLDFAAIEDKLEISSDSLSILSQFITFSRFGSSPMDIPVQDRSQSAIVAVLGTTKAALRQESKPIRVLHVLGGLGHDGIEVWLMNVLRKIDRSRVIFDFVVDAPSAGPFDQEICESGGRIFALTPPPRRCHSSPGCRDMPRQQHECFIDS
jgi:hypothetical protein